MSSASRDATRTRGVMRSSATRSVKRSERSSRVAVPSSSVPCSALARTSELSSPGERAERSSSAGSTPSLRTMALAMALSALISQRNAYANPLCSQTTARAVRSGSAIARFWGTSSPNTIDSAVASTQREHGGGGGRRALGEAERGEAGHEQGGDRGLGDVAGDQRGDRDEELAGRQLEGQGAVGALHDAGLAVAPCGDVRVDLTALQRGERELGRDGDRGAERQHGDGEQAEHGQQDGHDVDRARAGGVRRGEPGALLQPGSPGRAVGTVRLLVKGCGPSVRVRPR